jgi:hypothetical protein
MDLVQTTERVFRSITRPGNPSIGGDERMSREFQYAPLRCRVLGFCHLRRSVSHRSRRVVTEWASPVTVRRTTGTGPRPPNV